MLFFTFVGADVLECDGKWMRTMKKSSWPVVLEKTWGIKRPDAWLGVQSALDL
jgi:hypothetical protein